MPYNDFAYHLFKNSSREERVTFVITVIAVMDLTLCDWGIVSTIYAHVSELLILMVDCLNSKNR